MQPDQTGHPARLAVTAVGKKTFRIAVGAKVPATDLAHATPRQGSPRQPVQVGIPAGGMIRTGPKADLVIGMRLDKLPIDFISHLEMSGPNGRPQPDQNLRGVLKSGQGGLQHTIHQPPPAGMGYRNAISLGGAKKYRQAVGSHHHTAYSWPIGPYRIGLYSSLPGPSLDQGGAMNLSQPLQLAQGKSCPVRQPLAVVLDCLRVIPHMISQVQGFKRLATHTPGTQGHQGRHGGWCLPVRNQHMGIGGQIKSHRALPGAAYPVVHSSPRAKALPTPGSRHWPGVPAAAAWHAAPGAGTGADAPAAAR